jgi:uncharacterized membrane protein
LRGKSTVDVVFNSIYARACMGAGLAVLSGIRAFMPVGFLALYSRLEFQSAPVLSGTWFAFLDKTWVIVILLSLAVIEVVADKIFLFSSLKTQIMQPIRIVMGGIVFAAAMAPDGWIAMVVSGVLGLVIAGLADHVMRSTRPSATKDTAPIILVSVYTDVVVLIGTLLFVLVPLIGALLTFFLVLVVYRLRRRSKRKHKGLRILK